MAKLKYDLDQINSMKDRVSTLAGELIELEANLKAGLEALKEEWHTPAGEEFFKTVDMDWDQEVQEYINSLHTLEFMLDYAYQQYSGLTDRINSLRLQQH